MLALWLHRGDAPLRFWRKTLNNRDRIKVGETLRALSYHRGVFIHRVNAQRALAPLVVVCCSLVGISNPKPGREKYSSRRGMVGLNSSAASKNRDFPIVMYFGGLVWGNTEVLSDPSCKSSRSSLSTID